MSTHTHAHTHAHTHLFDAEVEEPGHVGEGGERRDRDSDGGDGGLEAKDSPANHVHHAVPQRVAEVHGGDARNYDAERLLARHPPHVLLCAREEHLRCGEEVRSTV